MIYRSNRDFKETRYDGAVETTCTKGRLSRVTKAVLVRFEAKPGKEAEVERFLTGGLTLALGEPATTRFARRFGPTSFGIFETSPDEAGRQAHLGGHLAVTLMAQASNLFAVRPGVGLVDSIAAKLPDAEGI